nr:integrase, catalytic region, zinc finger, CCHC-type, peptidase aspartic, catalytic [Tanacetum cinerariifolium]
MATLADKAILLGADNRPPMLEKKMYDSWKSRMELYMLNRQHGRMILEFIENGPLIWPSIEENGVTRPKKYSEERECKLYDEFNKFVYKKGETLREFYLRFSLLLNDMNIYNMKLGQFQVNTKFLNTLPPEWSKFMTDVKLVWDLHTTNIDQLHAYLVQHEFHANKVLNRSFSGEDLPIYAYEIKLRDSGCSKHMTGDRSQLSNFVNKFLGTVKFGNDHMEKIMGYGDYQIENVTISRVYFVEGLGHNLFSAGQLCDSDLEVAFRQHTCFIRNLEGVDLLTGSRGDNLYTLSLGDIMAENLGKLQPKADIGIFICYAPTKKAFWIYNRCTKRIFKTIHVDFDELATMASEHSSSGPTLHEMTPATFKPAASTGLHSSTIVDQDTPSPSNSQSIPKTQPPVIPNDVEEDNHDIEVALMGNDMYFGIPIPEVPSDQSSSSDIIHTIVHPNHQISEQNSKWTKDHPLENIIRKLARPVSTRLQLHEQALFCYYDAFLTSIEPTYKDALTQSYWIEAMQEDLNEFERLKVWELVPRPDKVTVITLKWIYKVKLDELGGIIKNKAWLVAHGYLQEKVDTPMVEKSKLDEDKEGKAVDPSHYHGMIDTLLYLRTSRHDLQLLYASFTDANHAGCQDTRRSTSDSLSKHIDIRYHFVKEHVENEVIELYFINTEYQLADIFTKALGKERIEFLINKLGIRSFTSETLKLLTDEVDE